MVKALHMSAVKIGNKYDLSLSGSALVRIGQVTIFPKLHLMAKII